MGTEVVSVIVPIYNAELYLERCLNSIIMQTWENIEIILVDDGSTDKSGEICENYSKRDTRISVIHKKNEGPATARNIGIYRAKGEYIVFVDSDDCIVQDYIQTLLTTLKEYKADMVVCGYYHMKSNKDPSLKKRRIKKKKYTVVSAEEMLKGWHGKYKHLETMPWNKLYKRELFLEHHISFPDGKFAEDVQTIHLVVAAADKIVITGQRLYYYYQVAGSLTHAVSKEKMINYILAQEIRLQYFKKNGYTKAYERMNIKKQKYYMLTYCITKCGDMKSRLMQSFMDCYKEVMNCTEIKQCEKIMFFVFKRCHKLIGRCCHGFN